MGSELTAGQAADSTAGQAASADIFGSARSSAQGPAREDLNHPDERKRAVYEAFKSKDPRFDGQLFVGVSSTGIYCRPVCSARMPKFENCTFFYSAAEAEKAGYRPCLCCRPELAPGLAPVDASKSLARRAADMLRENCTSRVGLETFAARLGYTDRHLRRVFEDAFQITPVEYLQTCRLLLAKSLLTDTQLTVEDVARASGFGSARRLNDLCKKRYRMTPTQIRKGARGRGGTCPGQVVLRLSYRKPYRFDKLLSFFASRVLAGVEKVDEKSYARTVRMPYGDREVFGWIRVEDDPRKSRLVLTMSESLLPVTSQVVARVRRQFDTDCDPAAVYEGIASMDSVVAGAAVEGTRLPGAFDPFETSVRAVLGQQISVVAANRLAHRIAEAYGKPIETGIEGLDRVFIAKEDVLGFEDVESAFGKLGVIKTRSRTILAIAELLASGELSFDVDAVVAEQIETLLAIKGIGPWSANYIAMRCMSYPDAFLETDAGIKHALPDYTPKERLALAEQWRPWRSYANICLWNSLAGQNV